MGIAAADQSVAIKIASVPSKGTAKSLASKKDRLRLTIGTSSVPEEC